uniref:Uncharacterized protein n=1 Tax=Falco tinnunculus TaxID=100819 RepID=A0A8C4U6Y6_FALTI
MLQEVASRLAVVSCGQCSPQVTAMAPWISLGPPLGTLAASLHQPHAVPREIFLGGIFPPYSVPGWPGRSRFLFLPWLNCILEIAFLVRMKQRLRFGKCHPQRPGTADSEGRRAKAVSIARGSETALRTTGPCHAPEGTLRPPLALRVWGSP